MTSLIIFLTCILTIVASEECSFETVNNDWFVTCYNVTFQNKSIYILIPDQLKNFKKTFIIKESNISVLPSDSTFELFSNFSVAVFSDNNINEIKQDAFKTLPNLVELYLSNNNLVLGTSDTVGYLHGLEILDLSNNAISDISDGYFLGSNLKTLNLSSNYLSDWQSVTRLTKIDILDFSHNDLSSFNLTQMSKTLTYLNLSNNQMRKFAECKNESLLSWSLYLLDLSCNGISDLEPLPLTHLKNLNTLLLSYNNITSLPRDYFSDLNHLRYLNLSHNNLEVIQYGIFDTLLYLEILDLSCNHLINLGNRHFYYLNNLAQLYIDNNILNKFDLKSKNKFPRRLKYISLDDNNFSCNYVSELIQELTYSGIEVAEGKHHNVTNIQGIICQQDQPERSSYRSNILVIVLSVLGVAILILSIPWCIIYIKRSRTRRSVLEDIELM